MHKSRPEASTSADSFTWTDDLRNVWQRLQKHNFEPDTSLNFTHRLARDHQWSVDETRAVIDEYRKFCFLAAVSSTPVTPSEKVDEVWHQHLIYSRDYWTIWCGEVLGMALHHDPTPGGTDAQMLYRRQYAETLALYERAFGPPDAEIWPATHVRFRQPSYQTIERSRWLLFPNPLAWLRDKHRR